MGSSSARVAYIFPHKGLTAYRYLPEQPETFATLIPSGAWRYSMEWFQRAFRPGVFGDDNTPGGRNLEEGA